MSKHIEVAEGLDTAIETVRSLVKVLVISYNDQITNLLKDNIVKSKTIERLEDKLTESR